MSGNKKTTKTIRLDDDMLEHIKTHKVNLGKWVRNKYNKEFINNEAKQLCITDLDGEIDNNFGILLGSFKTEEETKEYMKKLRRVIDLLDDY